MTQPKKRLVLAGGGHAHLYSLKHADQLVDKCAEVILISPDQFHYYSGMGPGMLSRIYEPAQVRFNVQALVESRGGIFKKGRVTAVEASKRTLMLEGGEKMSYDLVSFNVGSHVPMNLIPGSEGEAYAVKPIENLERVRETILNNIKKAIPKILLIGGGPAGVELAGNIWRLVHDHNGQAQITVANATDHLLPNLAEKAGRLAEQSLSQRGIKIVSDFMASSMTQGSVRSQSGEELSYDVAVLTIGIVPPRIFVESKLETSHDGALVVNDYLQSKSHPEIFGGGDCIAIQGKSLGRAGVYSVREAPILFKNFMASLIGTPLVPFKPQKRYLLIFNLGDDTGIFVRGKFVWKGKLAFALKTHIDKGFMSKFQDIKSLRDFI
jgi:NADH dehydrogenase FAD-containing subunit